MSEKKLSTFSRYAWFAVAFNLIVILWGVFLRASYSGDGCGQHWLTCRGEAIPSAPELKTVIEFSHRLTTALAGIVVLVLAGWAFRKFKRGNRIRTFAMLALLFIIVEGAIGGGLVLTGNTAANWTLSRPFWAAGHLINTFVLLAFLTLTAWSASRKSSDFSPLVNREIALVLIGAAVIVFVGITGSMAALTNMLFPSGTLTEGIAKDFDPDSHILLRLRILHPILSILSAVFLIFLADKLKRMASGSAITATWARNLSLLVLMQIFFGAATLLMLAPIVMQLGHLLQADLVWISYVLLGANFVFRDRDEDM
ncbi:MAG: COX15/CtaA family protein [Pyrinomonadaceae bacterium]